MPLYQKLMDLSEPRPKKIQVAVHQIVKLFAGPIFKVRIRSSSSAMDAPGTPPRRKPPKSKKPKADFFLPSSWHTWQKYHENWPDWPWQAKSTAKPKVLKRNLKRNPDAAGFTGKDFYVVGRGKALPRCGSAKHDKSKLWALPYEIKFASAAPLKLKVAKSSGTLLINRCTGRLR